MARPILNLDEAIFAGAKANGRYTSSRGRISDRIGAKNLGYNLTVLPPGKAQCPFHCHHGEEEGNREEEPDSSSLANAPG